MRRIIASVVDRDSFFEIGKLWGRSIITGFARLSGWPVALMAGDPMHYGGAWTARASEKITRFVDLAQVFHLPMVHLVDCPGFLIGPEAEKEGTIRYGMRAATAILQSRMPWCSVIVRKVFGVAGALHQNSSRYGMRVAWPSAEWGSLPIAGGLEAAYRAEIEAAPDPAAKRAEIEARIRKFASPMRGAERYDIEEIIDPRDTRKHSLRVRRARRAAAYTRAQCVRRSSLTRRRPSEFASRKVKVGVSTIRRRGPVSVHSDCEQPRIDHENETLRWPTNLDRAAFVARLVEVRIAPPRRFLPCRVTSVDGERYARDVAGLVGGQEESGVGHFERRIAGLGAPASAPPRSGRPSARSSFPLAPTERGRGHPVTRSRSWAPRLGVRSRAPPPSRPSR